MAHYRIGDDLYDIDPTTWQNADVSAVQRALGCSMSKFMDRIGEMDVDAIQAMIWVLRRRKEPSLRLDAVSFTVREYMASIETTDQDIREIWATLDEVQRDDLMGTFDEEQKARLFDASGELIPEERADPLEPTPDTATSEP